MFDNDNLLEVRRNVYIAKNDPQFYEKYLRFFPKDRSAIYQYALELENKGKISKSKEMYRISADLGYSLAKKKMMHFNNVEKQQMNSIFKETQKRNSLKTMTLLLIFIILFALLFWLFYTIRELHYHKTEEHFYETNKIYHSPVDTTTRNNSSNNNPYIDEQEKKYAIEELKGIVLLSALTNYKKERGRFPSDINVLASNYPENWISFVPDGISYTYKDITENFTLFSGNYKINEEEYLPLHLKFFPGTNQLGVLSGEQLLGLYTVASGKKDTLPSPLKVMQRIKNPNGGHGVYGTRGLELQDNFAIHGTDSPEEIGKKVSLGCLRLNNSDIELLFAYIPKGTVITVDDGMPGKPMFSMGLPPIPTPKKPQNPPMEETPDKFYNWKN